MAGRYDEWLAREPIWPSDDHVHHTYDEPVICRDCGVQIGDGWVTTGVASGASCDRCYRWRVDHHVEFDPLPICQIKRGDRW